MDPLLELFTSLFGGLEPQDLFTGPEESLGTQVWVYDASGTRIELTDPANQGGDISTRVGAGFGNAANKYSWSSALYDDGEGGEDLYIGTFNAFFDYRGGVAAFIKISQQSKVGAELDVSNPSGFFSALTDNEFFPTLIDTQGGEIWKYESLTQGDPGAAGGTWSKVYDAADVPELGPDVAGFRNMTSFDGKLLAASSSSLIFDFLSINQDQPTTISVYDGSDWSVLTGGPFDDPTNASIRTMKQVGDKLLIGTENAKDGAQLWALDFAGDSVVPLWERLTDLPSYTFTDISGADLSDLYGKSPVDPASTGDILNLSNFAGLEGKFLIGTWQPYALYMGDINDPTGDYKPIILPENALLLSPAPIDNGVMRMEEYNGYIYIGSVNYSGGTSVFRISIESLKSLTSGQASLNPFQLSPEALGLALFTSPWEVLTSDGFRNIQDNIIGGTTVEELVRGSGIADPSGNGISTYSWSMKVVNDKLYIGDFSGEAGVARLYEITDTGIRGDASGNFSSYGFALGGPNSFKDGSNNTVSIKLLEDQFGPEAYGLRTMQAYTPNLSTQNGQGTPTNLIIGDADPFDSEIGLLNRFLDDPTRQIKLIVGENSGGENDDVLFGSGVDVEIEGLGGEDIIIGTRFDDKLDGGADQDLMIGNLGADKMYGGDQSDLMWGDLPSFGSNSIAEGLALQLRALLLQAMSPEMMQEWLQAAPTAESLMAILQDLGLDTPGAQEAFWIMSQIGAGSAMWGEELLPSIAALGDAGRNLRLSSFNDIMYGNAGEDIMFGGLGGDKMYGGDNDDIIIGQQGADSLWGNSGDDQLEGGRDRDYYSGGLGNDIYDLRCAMDSSGNMIMQTDGQIDTIVYARGDFETVAPKLAEETVFGFEQGLDKIDIDKKRVSFDYQGNVATLTYNKNGSIITLTNDDANFLWQSTDFI